jgi:predicted nucleic acid-binding protein
MRYWDSSAIVPLCCDQPASRDVLSLLAADDELVVWWATPVECASALARLEREGALSERELRPARAVLAAMSKRWSEVNATPAVRDLAEQLLRRHPLRAADALQLAAALVWRTGLPANSPLVALDDRLRTAATAEGFQALP